MSAPARRPRIATVWLGGCSGCHMSFLDLDERLLELAGLVDLVYSPIADVKEFPEDVDVTLVEGAVANEDNLAMIKKVRARTRVLIAMGDCAVTANVTALRNPLPLQKVLAASGYRELVDPVPRLLPRVQPVHKVVPVDGFLPGCPPTADTTTGLRRVLIDPVTRIEGHAKISLYVDEAGEVADARFHVTEFRGFEKFCQGRPFWEMPGITSRICGICPVSHLLASAKAGDRILGVTPPPAADKLRRLMNLAQIVQSHALSFFHLSSPDLLLGFDAPATQRNVLALAASHPDVARAGIRMRQFGQRVIAALGGQSIHPAWAVPGGVREPLTAEGRDAIKAALPEQLEAIVRTIALLKGAEARFADEVASFGSFPSMFMSLIGPDDTWEHHDGVIRLIDARGQIVEPAIDPQRYDEYLAEEAEPWSYLKFPYYRAAGYPDGMYRVGPLARLNVCRRFGTPLADRELAEFKTRGEGAVLGSFHYHYARLVEILGALELIERSIDDPDLLSPKCRAVAGVNRLAGVGVSEAPRGTLFHHYRVDEDGLVEWVNLLIATGQNNLAMNRTVAQVARHYVHGGKLDDGVMNRIEAGVRAYDPCLSCSTHAVGKMPLVVRLIGPDGAALDERRR